MIAFKEEVQNATGQHFQFTGIATSLDAMAIGVRLTFLQVDIVHTAMTIGMMTMIMATLGGADRSLYWPCAWQKS